MSADQIIAQVLVEGISGKCPICGGHKPATVHFTCAACWPKLPGNDRVALGAMLMRKQPTETKLASVVRKYLAKQDGLRR